MLGQLTVAIAFFFVVFQHSDGRFFDEVPVSISFSLFSLVIKSNQITFLLSCLTFCSQQKCFLEKAVSMRQLSAFISLFTSNCVSG